MAVLSLLLILVFRPALSLTIDLPSIPLTEDGVNRYLENISSLWNQYYAGDNTVNIFQQIFDKDIIVCAHDDVCTVGIGKAISNLQQFQSYFQRGWMTTIDSSVKLITFGDHSISYVQTGVFETAFPMPSLSGFNNQFTVSQHSINIFNYDQENGKVTIAQMDNIYDEDDGNAFTDFRGALFRLFSGFTTKAKAEYEVAVINGLIDPNIHLSPSTNKDVFILLSGVAAVIVFILITVYFCYRLCCGKRRKHKKKKYQRVKDTDQSATDTETDLNNS